MNQEELIHAYIDGRLSDVDFPRFEKLLKESAEARKMLLDFGVIESKLNSFGQQEQVNTQLNEGHTSVTKKLLVFAYAATLVLLLGFAYWLHQTPSPIARIQSSEGASWESSLPTSVGSDLVSGTMKLQTGLATLFMESGAEIVLEGPAEVELISSMKIKLLGGSCVVDVPQNAIGFVVETPHGYAIDYGTNFSVLVDRNRDSSSFEVMSGEIAVHLPNGNSEVRLNDLEGAEIRSGELLASDGFGTKPNSTLSAKGQVKRVLSHENATSVIRNNQRDLYLSEELLLVKHSESLPSFDRRAMMEFDLKEMNLSRVKQVSLSLNLVTDYPRTGFRAYLPQENIFAVYGIRESWESGLSWENAPQPDEGELLGQFTILRSEQSGSFGIEGPKLLDFLRSGGNKLLLVRLTSELHPSGLVHAFAGATHPNSVPPALEFTMK